MWSPPGSSAQLTMRPSTCAQRHMFLGSISNSVIRGSRCRCLNQPRLTPPLIQKEPAFCSNHTGTISTEPSLRLVPMITGKTSSVNACIFGLSSTAMPQPLSLLHHRLLQDHHHLARFEAQFVVDREHSSVIRAVIGVHVRDPLLRRVTGHQHLQDSRDPSTAMAAEHAGVADLGRAIRAAKKITQADDVIAVPGDEKALEQDRRALEDASSKRRQGRIL